MSDGQLPLLEDFLAASEIVRRVTRETDLLYSRHFSERTGNEVYLKPENLQFTGAYKIRGAYYKISRMSEQERSRGLVTASAGNHAQGVAYAAKAFGVRAVIVMPTTTPLIKVERTRSYGAEIVLHGDIYDEAYTEAEKLAEENGYTFIHPFDDIDVATGQGTVGMEILDSLPDADIILVPVGGGGLAAGIARAVKLRDPRVRVVGVEPSGAACLAASLAAGKVVTLDSVNTIADGTAVKRIGEKIFPILQEDLDEVITVDDEELIVAFLDMVENHKLIVENSGLLTVAALRHFAGMGKKIAAVLSGGNMDVITMSQVVQNGLIARDRIFTISVLLPDRPGELVRVSTVVAKQRGNIIKLEHNQFYSTNRNAAVELRITMEAFGTEHKNEIMKALEEAGFRPRLVRTTL